MCFSFFSGVSFKMKGVVVFTILGAFTVHTLAQDYDWQSPIEANIRDGGPINIGKPRARMHRPGSQIEERQIGINPDEEPVLTAHRLSLAGPTRRVNWGHVIQSVGHAVAQGIQAYQQYSKGRAAQSDDASAEALAHSKRFAIEVLLHTLFDPQVAEYLHGLNGCHVEEFVPQRSSGGWTSPGKPPPYVTGSYP